MIGREVPLPPPPPPKPVTDEILILVPVAGGRCDWRPLLSHPDPDPEYLQKVVEAAGRKPLRDSL